VYEPAAAYFDQLHASPGGYQVLKKWLSYRERSILHRPLTQEDAEQFTHHTRRITALLAVNAALDGHYKALL